MRQNCSQNQLPVVTPDVKRQGDVTIPKAPEGFDNFTWVLNKSPNMFRNKACPLLGVDNPFVWSKGPSL